MAITQYSIPTEEKKVKWMKIHKTDLDNNILSVSDIVDNANNISFRFANNSIAIFNILGIVDKGDHVLIQGEITNEDGLKMKDNSKVLDYSLFTHSNLSTSSTNGITTSIIASETDIFHNILFSHSMFGQSTPPVFPDSFRSGSGGDTYYQFGKMPTATLQWKLAGSAKTFVSTSNEIYFGMRPGLYLSNDLLTPHPFPGRIADAFEFPERYQYVFPLSQSWDQAYVPTTMDTLNPEVPIMYGDDSPNPVILNNSSYTDFEISGSVGAQWMMSESKWAPTLACAYEEEVHFNSLTWSLHFFNDSNDGATGPSSDNLPQTFTSSFVPATSASILFEPIFPSPFQNSNWDVNMNNINDNRLNSFLMNVDYSTDLALPINLQPIRSRVEKKTSTPDSNYTTKRIIDPRYNGSKLSSYDYNAYTPPSASASFKFTPVESGSWGGDISYGKTAVIDKRPTHFAHFVESHPTLEAMGEMEFTIDYLIPVDIEVGENSNAKSVPSIGSLPGVIKVNGDGTYQYEVSNIFEKKRKASIDFSQNVSASINWGSLETLPHPIVQGGARFKGIIGNQSGNFNAIGGQNNTIYTTISSSILTVNQMGAGSINFVTTMSNGLGFEGNGNNLAESFNLNNILYKNKVPLESLWYRRWMPVSASLGSIGYSDESLIFLPKRGDEIRMLSSSEDALVFTITGMITSSNSWIGASVTCSVTPDPLSFEFPATSSFFIRRKVDQDNKVLLRVPPVQGTLGNTTPSSDGFLIPNDLSKDQKTRAGHLIATLRGDNLFS